MKIISHRGYCKWHPANSIEAFEAAMELEVDGIETDLRVTKDDQLVLFHDRHIGPARVEDLTYLELCSTAGRRVTLAHEALEQFDGILWNLEIKTLAAVDATRRLLDTFHRSRQLLVTSFWHNVAELFSNAFDVQCGILVAHRPFDSADTVWLRASNVTAIVWKYEFVDDAMLAQAQAAGMTNLVYMLNSRQDHAEAMERGIDGVITDHPEFLSHARTQ